MKKTQDMLTTITFLDIEVKIVNDSWKSGDETGSFMSYEITDDNSIEVNYGWSDYEEGDNNTLVISFGDQIKVDISSGGYSVMGGDYDESRNLFFNEISELIKYLSEEL